MPADILSVGGIVFDDYSTPTLMMGGGNQMLVVHKLPGGSRAIDQLGPDESDVTWEGQFFGNNAYFTALSLDGIRQQGQVVPLIWGGQFRQVIVSNFIYRVRRLPTWVFYNIVCTVYQNPMLGGLDAVVPSVDALVTSDLALAVGL